MNKTTWIIICIVLAVGISLLIKNDANQPLLMQAINYVSPGNSAMNDQGGDQQAVDEMNDENDEDEAADDAIPTEPTVKEAAEGYATYNEAVVQDALDSGKKVALFFWASWCPNCVALNGNIETNYKNIPADTMIFKVDYDTSDALKEKYGVTTQHTLVYINEDMDEVNQVSGPTNLDEVLAGFNG